MPSDGWNTAEDPSPQLERGTWDQEKGLRQKPRSGRKDTTECQFSWEGGKLSFPHSELGEKGPQLLETQKSRKSSSFLGFVGQSQVSEETEAATSS